MPPFFFLLLLLLRHSLRFPRNAPHQGSGVSPSLAKENGGPEQRKTNRNQEKWRIKEAKSQKRNSVLGGQFRCCAWRDEEQQ